MRDPPAVLRCKCLALGLDAAVWDPPRHRPPGVSQSLQEGARRVGLDAGVPHTVIRCKGAACGLDAGVPPTRLCI